MFNALIIFCLLFFNDGWGFLTTISPPQCQYGGVYGFCFAVFTALLLSITWHLVRIYQGVDGVRLTLVTTTRT